MGVGEVAQDGWGEGELGVAEGGVSVCGRKGGWRVSVCGSMKD